MAPFGIAPPGPSDVFHVSLEDPSHVNRPDNALAPGTLDSAVGLRQISMPHPLKKISRVRRHQSEPLTARERQIARVMAEGLTNKEIAQRLKLAEGTVKVHLHRIYRKLGMANRTALAVRASNQTL
jgi:DNA-binding NarL/FixJ family response regulator